MTFNQARAISKANALHVRRESWPVDQYVMIWRGTWFYFDAGLVRPVRAGDYSAADLLANDWTTVPSALAACPVDPAIGSTGGGPPTAESPAFAAAFSPDATSTGSTGDAEHHGSGVGGGGGGGGSDDPAPVLPPVDPGTSVRVRFSGTTHADLHDAFGFEYVRGIVSLDGTFTLDPAGANEWKTTFTRGEFWIDGTPPHADHSYIWNVTAARSTTDGVDYWTVTLQCLNTDPAGGSTLTGGFYSEPAIRSATQTNLDAGSGGSVFFGGTANVL
jgi:hypothetical protein